MLLRLALALLALGSLATPLAAHPDTLRELLAARDCALADLCPAHGAATSFLGLLNGALWPFSLALLAAVGAPFVTAWWGVLAGDALVVAFAGRRREPVGAAVAGAVALLWLLQIRRETVVWSPSLLPLFGALTLALWLRGRDHAFAHPAWALGLGALLGLHVDAHPAAAAPALLWALAALLVSARPLLVAAGLAAGFSLALLPLSASTQLENAAALGRALGAGATLGAAALASASVAAGRWWLAQRGAASMRPAAAGPALVLGGTLAALGLGHLALGHDLALRYADALVAPGAWCIGALASRYAARPLRAAPVVALLAIGLAVGLLQGPARALGERWPVVEATAAAHDALGLRYPATLTRLQARECRSLGAAVETLAPREAWQPRAPNPTGVQVVHLDPATTPNTASGWRLVDDAGRYRTWLRERALWTDVGAGELCVLAAGGRRCEPMVPGRWTPPSDDAADRAANDAVAPLHARAMPRFGWLAPPAEGSSATRARIALRVTEGPARWVHVLDLPHERCPWRVVEVQGVPAQVASDGASVRVGGEGEAEGSLVVEKAWGGDCGPAWRWAYGPPCLFEREAGDPPTQAWIIP
ncbi:MAG: hypothetical protein RIT45_1117 [Pseudomonadota bacterium]